MERDKYGTLGQGEKNQAGENGQTQIRLGEPIEVTYLDDGSEDTFTVMVVREAELKQAAIQHKDSPIKPIGDKTALGKRLLGSLPGTEIELERPAEPGKQKDIIKIRISKRGDVENQKQKI